MIRRRVLPVALALAALVLAAGLAALGDDARRFGDAIRGDDLRFQLGPGPGGMWDASESFPFGAARRILAVDDDLAFRRAIRLLRLSNPRASFVGGFEEVGLRSQAELALARVEQTDPDLRRSSRAAVLLGDLAFGDALGDSTQTSIFLQKGAAKFREAIRLDPTNEDAKFNLELLLRLVRSSARSRVETEGGARGGGTSAGAGLTLPGKGY